MKHLLIHAWALYRAGSHYYIPYTHFIYLREIAKYFDRVTFLSPVKTLAVEPGGMPNVSDAVTNATIVPLPWYSSYADAMRLYFSFKNAYKQAGECTHVYVRYPVPYGWMCRRYFSPHNRIIHFVGDPVDTINSNTSINAIQRFFKTSLFMPEFRRYMMACKEARVFTNGPHLQTKLSRYGVKATSLVSSTLLDDDFYFDEDKILDPVQPRILFSGYLRRAKGLGTLLEAFTYIKQQCPGARLTIVGDGEMKQELLVQIAALQLQDSCELTGHIEDRGRLNTLLRSHDVFLFTSISEGSPRAVLEAMANGLPVVTTKVGSLPDTFSHGTHVLFAETGDSNQLAQHVITLINNRLLVANLRRNAFDLAKQHTLQPFIQRIFGET